MSILHALTSLYDRLESSGKAPSYGFSRENTSYAILLSPEGSLSDVLDMRDTSARTPRPRRLEVPRAVKRTGQPAPNFLWDKTSFVLGAGTGASSRVLREHAAFKAFHERQLASSNDEGAQALLRFLRGWRVEEYHDLPHALEMLDTSIVFSLEDEMQFLHKRSSVKQIWLDHLTSEQGASGLCLVTGEQTSIARLHPSVKGVAGAQGSGASIVSFDKDAFKSFGKERGANAPVSERAAFAYATSLNTLLERGSRQRIRIGDATTLFWADASGNEAKASAAEGFFLEFLSGPPTDEEEAAKIRDKLAAVTQGRPLFEVDPEVDEDTRFFVLGLAPNAARLSIRFWYEDSIGAISRRIGEHWRDLHLEPTPWRTPPSARRLLYETAVQRKAESIPPTLTGAVMRAILSGGRYPRSLLTTVIVRMRTDKEITGLRIAICKASLARDHRLGFEEEDVPVSLNPDETNPAYRLGRLFAVYENVQRAALGNVNATIKDRFFASASATPASVFPLLERSASNHIASLRKGDKGGLAHWFEKEIDSIFSGVGSTFPRSLRLEDQGRFAIGYHHQRATKRGTPESEGEGIGTGTHEGSQP